MNDLNSATEWCNTLTTRRLIGMADKVSSLADDVDVLQFMVAWDNYPERRGPNSRAQAFDAWRARTKGGATARQRIEGVLRYRHWCECTGKIGTEEVMPAFVFFSRADLYDGLWDDYPSSSAGGEIKTEAAPW